MSYFGIQGYLEFFLDHQNLKNQIPQIRHKDKHLNKSSSSKQFFPKSITKLPFS